MGVVNKELRSAVCGSLDDASSKLNGQLEGVTEARRCGDSRLKSSTLDNAVSSAGKDTGNAHERVSICGILQKHPRPRTRTANRLNSVW
jgi:hypothetical protein